MLSQFLKSHFFSLLLLRFLHLFVFRCVHGLKKLSLCSYRTQVVQLQPSRFRRHKPPLIVSSEQHQLVIIDGRAVPRPPLSKFQIYLAPSLRVDLEDVAVAQERRVFGYPSIDHKHMLSFEIGARMLISSHSLLIVIIVTWPDSLGIHLSPKHGPLERVQHEERAIQLPCLALTPKEVHAFRPGFGFFEFFSIIVALVKLRQPHRIGDRYHCAK